MNVALFIDSPPTEDWKLARGRGLL